MAIKPKNKRRKANKWVTLKLRESDLDLLDELLVIAQDMAILASKGKAHSLQNRLIALSRSLDI